MRADLRQEPIHFSPDHPVTIDSDPDVDVGVIYLTDAGERRIFRKFAHSWQDMSMFAK
jgi:hypothetical protein